LSLVPQQAHQTHYMGMPDVPTWCGAIVDTAC
jgi:hypothetical protein